MSDRLWSPQMRKWMLDADTHGIPIGLAKIGRRREVGFGGGNPYTNRLTDDGGLRIIDSPSGEFGNQPRTIDKPI